MLQGRNEFCNKIITTTLDFLTWEEAFMCMSDERLPPYLRAKYCSLVIGKSSLSLSLSLPLL